MYTSFELFVHQKSDYPFNKNTSQIQLPFYPGRLAHYRENCPQDVKEEFEEYMKHEHEIWTLKELYYLMCYAFDSLHLQSVDFKLVAAMMNMKLHEISLYRPAGYFTPELCKYHFSCQLEKCKILWNALDAKPLTEQIEQMIAYYGAKDAMKKVEFFNIPENFEYLKMYKARNIPKEDMTKGLEVVKQYFQFIPKYHDHDHPEFECVIPLLKDLPKECCFINHGFYPPRKAYSPSLLSKECSLKSSAELTKYLNEPSSSSELSEDESSTSLTKLSCKSSVHHCKKLSTNPMLELYESHRFHLFEEKIGYTFNDKAILIQAFTHTSFNDVIGSYEHLEFLGNSVLNYLITRYLYEHMKNCNPCELNDLRSALVNNVVFASLAVDYDMQQFLLLADPQLNLMIGKFVELNKQKDNFNDYLHLTIKNEIIDGMVGNPTSIEVPKILAGIFESLAGAIYHDCGSDLDKVWEIFYAIMKEAITNCCLMTDNKCLK